MEEEKTSKPDEMEGGFAVVDRERLIEEETREVTPWYKFFIQAFTAPGKMMEECYGQEPYRGASYGVVGCLLFTALYTWITFMNPKVKEVTINALRQSGKVAEESLGQTYSVTMISGILGATVLVFFYVLLTAIVFQILKAIAKDKAKFSNIYSMALTGKMVSTFILLIDACVAYMIGVSGSVFQLGSLMQNAAELPAFMRALCQMGSLGNIIYFIWLIIGYKAVTHVSTKKAVIIAAIYEIIYLLVTVGMINASMMAQQMTP